MILKHNNITFPDSTVQSTTGLMLTDNPIQPVKDSVLELNSINVQGDGANNIQQWSHSWTMTNNTTTWILYNTGSYSDIHFILTAQMNASSYFFGVWTGTFGGYGAQYGQRANINGGISLSYQELSPGFGRIGITRAGGSAPTATVSAQCLMFGGEGPAAYVGTIW
jgi:hypothetical protein